MLHFFPVVLILQGNVAKENIEKNFQKGNVEMKNALREDQK